MANYKFFKMKGPEAENSGYFVPGLYQLVWCWPVLKRFGLRYVRERLRGNTIWYTDEAKYDQVIARLEELKKTRIFGYRDWE